MSYLEELSKLDRHQRRDFVRAAASNISYRARQNLDAETALSLQKKSYELYKAARKFSSDVGLYVIDRDVLYATRLIEFRLALAIVKGQKEGRILSRGNARHSDSPGLAVRDFYGNNSAMWSSNNQLTRWFTFDEYVTLLNTTGVLSRAAVMRAARTGVLDKDPSGQAKQIEEMARNGWTRKAIRKELGIGEDRMQTLVRDHELTFPADTTVGRTRLVDMNKLARDTATMIINVAGPLDDIEPTDLTMDDLEELSTELAGALRIIYRFNRKIKEHIQNGNTTTAVRTQAPAPQDRVDSDPGVHPAR